MCLWSRCVQVESLRCRLQRKANEEMLLVSPVDLASTWNVRIGMEDGVQLTQRDRGLGSVKCFAGKQALFVGNVMKMAIKTEVMWL